MWKSMRVSESTLRRHQRENQYVGKKGAEGVKEHALDVYVYKDG